jgi:hypothetical protein
LFTSHVSYANIYTFMAITYLKHANLDFLDH